MSLPLRQGEPARLRHSGTRPRRHPQLSIVRTETAPIRRSRLLLLLERLGLVRPQGAEGKSWTPAEEPWVFEGPVRVVTNPRDIYLA